MKTTQRILTVFGGQVRILIRPVEGGYECSWDPDRNRGDGRRDLIATGRGETEAEAIRAYMRSCHRLANLPAGSLYE